MKKIFSKKMCICLILLLFSFVHLPLSFAEESLPEIDSPSALLMDFNSGKIIYEKNINKKMYPASLTKILTAIIVLENCNLDDIATVSSNSVKSISFGYVTANLQVGEELTVEQLLYVLMVGSSNDAAIVLAEHVSGSVENFVILMNEKAKELGCKNSNFVNPNGEHNENHYSTAYDLALIARYAMKNETFRKIASTTYYKLPTTNKYNKDDRFFTTTNSLLLKNSSLKEKNFYYKYALGIKTGFTTPAGNCLISAANVNNLELITVILGANTSEQRYLDTISLFKYGFNNYIQKEIANSGDFIQTVNIKNATRKTKKLNAIISDDVYVLCKKEDSDSTFLPSITLNKDLKAPIKTGDIIGTVKYNVEGIDYTQYLLSNNDVEKSYWCVLPIILIFIIIIWYIIIKIYLKPKKTKKKGIS